MDVELITGCRRAEDSSVFVLAFITRDFILSRLSARPYFTENLLFSELEQSTEPSAVF